MAELAGLYLAGVSLVGLATAVADAFERFDTGRNLGKDYEHYSLQLELAKLAYQRWLKSVTITADLDEVDVEGHVQVATEDEIEAVERLLGEIQVAFKDAEKSSRRYEFASEPQAASASGLTADEGVVDLRARVKEATKKRQMGSGFRNKIRWILRDSNVFKTLSERVVKNVNSLTEMFPAATQKAQDQLAAVELEEVAPPGNSQRLELLLEAAKDVDPILYERAADVKREGHYYENATLADRAIVVFGNQLALGAQDPGTRHEYRNISVSGDAKAIIGDRVGMEDIFTPEERASMKHLSMSDDQDTEP